MLSALDSPPGLDPVLKLDGQTRACNLGLHVLKIYHGGQCALLLWCAGTARAAACDGHCSGAGASAGHRGT